MEKTVIAYYTGTGNTLELAKRIKEAELVDIIKINEGKELNLIWKEQMKHHMSMVLPKKIEKEWIHLLKHYYSS